MHLLVSDNGMLGILPEIEIDRTDPRYDSTVVDDDRFNRDERIHNDDRLYRDSRDVYVVADRFEPFRWAIQVSHRPRR